MVHYSYQGITGYNCISISEHQCFYLSKQCRSWWCLFRTLSPGDRKFTTWLWDIWVFFFTSTVFAYLNSNNNWIDYIFKTKVSKCLQQYRSKSDYLLFLICHFAVSISIKVLFPTLAYMNLQISLIILLSLSVLKIYLAKRDIFSFCFVGPDLGPNCLKRLSADDISRQKVNYPVHLYIISLLIW